MNEPTRKVDRGGQRYALVPLEVLKERAPELLDDAVWVPDEGTPWTVAERHIFEGTSKAKAWREYLGLSQTEVARRLGISQAALSKTETSKRPRAATLERLANALGISAEQLSD